jgi:hypothetical protein
MNLGHNLMHGAYHSKLIASEEERGTLNSTVTELMQRVSCHIRS